MIIFECYWGLDNRGKKYWPALYREPAHVTPRTHARTPLMLAINAGSLVLSPSRILGNSSVSESDFASPYSQVVAAVIPKDASVSRADSV